MQFIYNVYFFYLKIKELNAYHVWLVFFLFRKLIMKKASFSYSKDFGKNFFEAIFKKFFWDW